MKKTITLKFNKLPKNCRECPLYNNSYYKEDEPWFGDGIVHYCPFGGDNWGSAIERPNNCPIGRIIELDEKDKPINSPYNIDKCEFNRLLNNYEDFFDDHLTRNELVDKVNYPQTIDDLRFIAACCHYKDGWAYYEAKKLHIN